MQEEVEQRSVTLIVNTGKFTGRVLKAAIAKYMAHRRDKSRQKQTTDVIPHGKMTVKQLAEQNQGMSSFEMQKDDGIRQFERVCRKYGVDYAVRRVNGEKPKYVIFFKGRDQDAIKSAFTEFMDKQVKKQNRQPLKKRLARVMPQVGSKDQSRERNKHQERSR
ncbi:MAG: PcfB family protein [Oscillospiraceae bacterium]|nr:PcfB family protein [Oscillospiraceae bacterium]